MVVSLRETSLVLAVLASLACTPRMKTPTAEPPAKESSPPGAEAAEPPPVAIDVRAPTKLDAWRKLDEAGTAAVRNADPEQRIVACKAWIAANPQHEGRGPVLAALTDAMIDKGGFDPAELAGYVAERAKLDEHSYLVPLELVRDF